MCIGNVGGRRLAALSPLREEEGGGPRAKQGASALVLIA